MIISTRGRYALRVMIDLSQQDPDSYTPLKEIAARQEISEKYLENILKSLVTQGFILGLRGKGGGYRLVAQRRLVGARPKPVSSGQHGPKCQRRFAPYFHNLNAPFPAFFPARCSPSECQCSP